MTTLADALGADDDLLGIFPSRPAEIRIGRISTSGQKLDRQIDALTLAGSTTTSSTSRNCGPPASPAQLEGSTR